MREKVKLALRIKGAAYDDEVTDLIKAAIADLRIVGIIVPDEIEGSPEAGDPLLVRAIVLYAKAAFGYNDDAERYRAAYDYLKCGLALTGDYIGRDET